MVKLDLVVNAWDAFWFPELAHISQMGMEKSGNLGGIV